MKTTLTSLFLVSFSFVFISTCFSQKILWEKSYGGIHSEYLMDAQPTADYGFILAGSSLSIKSGNKTEGNKGDLDYWIWKMDENGDLDWQKTLGGSGSDFLMSIALTNDGGYILGGLSSSDKGFDKESDSKGQDDFWIVKLNARGAMEWQKTIGGSGQEKLQSIKKTRDGGYIIGGSSSSEPIKDDLSTGVSNKTDKTSPNYGNLDYWVVKLDKNGKIEWQKSYGGIYQDELRSIESTVDGGYIVGGYSNSTRSENNSEGNKFDDNLGMGDYWILKLDNQGAIEWQKTIGGTGDDQLYVVHQTYDKGYMIGGNSNSTHTTDGGNGSKSIDGTDMWVVKLDEKGEMIWQETYNFDKVDFLTSLIENEDHSFLIGGYSPQTKESTSSLSKIGKKADKGVDDYIALKINEKGEEIWNKTVGSDGVDILKKSYRNPRWRLFNGWNEPHPQPLSEGEGSKQLF